MPLAKPKNDFLTASERVYADIRKSLFAKELHPGQRLPEAVLAERYGVSRTPVREALRKLANEGLVLFAPNSGARLVSPSPDEIAQAYELREYLETLTVARAAERMTPLQLCRLRESIEEEERIFGERDLERYLEINIVFHSIIAESSGNTLLAEYVENILSRTYVYMLLFESFFDFDNNPSLEEHRRITDALETADAGKARELMHLHIGLSERSLKQPR